MRELLLLSVVLLASCGGHRNPPAFEPKGQTKCSIAKSQLRPLIVEWPSADRLDLEALAKQGMVAVRYEGCEMEVLRGCKVEGVYRYSAATRQDDRVHIRDEDSLYANIPVYAAKFEGALKTAGELTVSMSMVGRYEASRPSVSTAELKGECARATHVVVSLTAGAFEFFSGAEDGVSGGVSVAGVGAGAKTSREHTTLNRAGKAEACDKASVHDREPPDGCGAVLRIEVTAIAGVVAQPTSQSTATTPPVIAHPGVMAAVDPQCPPGMDKTKDGCTTHWDYSKTGDRCPAGTAYDAKTKNCSPDGGANCPSGTRFEAGKGCMAGPPRPQAAPQPAPRCPAGMAGVPGGAFGSSSGMTEVAPFCMDIHKVTVDEYKSCVNARKCTANGITCEGDYKPFANWGVAGRERHPMNCVSYEQALGYCQAMGKRLPAIHEWEWEGRGGLLARKHPWGDQPAREDLMCWRRSTGAPLSCQIGTHPAGASLHGVQDMLGNVEDWVSDTASGWRHLKGGWAGMHNEQDIAVESTADHWPGNKPDQYPHYGIRCALTPH